ncbi:cytochrome P450 [Actinomadura sp. ATCC 31491]|uniref:Cytochrome P450 n=1 Tax=Actinomadura luzonensis TaxID=2805427 RepID=A0ABT0FXT3_9ACTN|nr:cytochrome P450 [Actinomadura luzonensis]MCK2217161.1 cytochrome P450 [Actinomadura luzonensis]
MPHATDPSVTSPHVLPLHKAVPRLVKDPVTELARMGVEARGKVVRLDLGPFRPYLISHPDHVQQVLKTDWTNFVREGMFWRPVQRVTGRSILGEGDGWASARKILQPLFTARYTASLAEDMADIIHGCMAELDGYARAGRPIDGGHQMTSIVNQAVIKVLFGGRISREVAERLQPEFATCATSIAFRLLVPFAPYSIKVPGDRAFLRSAKKIDEIVYPLIEQARRERPHSNEVVSALIAARLEQEGEVDLKQVRDDLVSIYGAASETTAMSLTWLWSVLHDHPEVNARLQDEIAGVVGGGPVRPAHMERLPYLRMVLQELLRVHPSAWIIPRQTVADTEIGGVRIKAGSQVLVSPYTTHRLPEFWERPLEFDPERWADERSARRHRYAFIPFGAGPHVCLGQALFYVEAPLVIANVLSRYRQVLTNPQPLTPVPGASVRPKEKLLLRLEPRR